MVWDKYYIFFIHFTIFMLTIYHHAVVMWLY